MDNPYPRVSALAETFPTLQGLPGVTPFDSRRFARSARTLGSGGRHAALFVLGVFNCSPDLRWNFGALFPKRFDVLLAMASWDDQHRAAFSAWARAPWWA